MSGIVKILRTLTSGNQPSGRAYGEPYANFADRMFGVVDNSGNPQPFAGPGVDLGGYINKVRNGTFDVWQRGTSMTPASAAYTADGWQLGWTGAAPSISQGLNGGGSNIRSGSTFVIGGVAGNTGSTLLGKIESFVSTALGGFNVTFQCRILNSTAASITPQLTITHPTVRDNYGSTATDLAATNLQACAAGVATTVAYTFAFPAASGVLGLAATLTLPGITTASIAISDVDIRATPGWPIGLCANPPPVETRPASTELVFCQRYFEPITTFSGGFISSTQAYAVCTFRTSKRITPTISLVGGTITNGISDPGISNYNISGFFATSGFGRDGGILGITSSGGTAQHVALSGSPTAIGTAIQASAEL